MNQDDYISWKSLPSNKESSTSTNATDHQYDGTSFLAAALIPRPTAWIAVYPPVANDAEVENVPLVSLVEGYCGASDRPPTLMLGSDSIPAQILRGLRENGVCTLSVATERETMIYCRAAERMSASLGEMSGPAKTFREAGLLPCRPPSVLDSLPIPEEQADEGSKSTNYFRRPPAVDTSPVQMHCRLILDVPLIQRSQKDHDCTKSQNDHRQENEGHQNIPSMLLLQIDTYVIKGGTLRKQSSLYPGKTTTHGNPDVRSITAKIDCLLLRPLASLGNGQFGKVGCIYHMGRPRPILNKNTLSKSQALINSCKPGINAQADARELNEDTCNNIDWESHSMWEIDDITAVDSRYTIDFVKEGDGETITYTYRIDSFCPLGYNPMKQVVCPRFVGWISSYGVHNNSNKNKETVRIPHISPYSFFMDVARGSRPMVAFAACPRSDEFSNSDNDESDSEDNSNNDGAYWKDAQRDAEQTGVFCVNLVSQELAWAMNASAAPLGKGLSEFRLMEGGGSLTNNDCKRDDYEYALKQGTVPTHAPAPTIDAPFVPESPIFMECQYVKTVKIPEINKNDSMYSLVVGEVVNIHIRKECLEPDAETVKELGSQNNQHFNRSIDLTKVRPVARLGYGQEYTIVLEHIASQRR